MLSSTYVKDNTKNFLIFFVDVLIYDYTQLENERYRISFFLTKVVKFHILIILTQNLFLCFLTQYIHTKLCVMLKFVINIVIGSFDFYKISFLNDRAV